VTTVKAPGAVSLSGALRFADGASPASRLLQVQYQPKAGAAWQVLTTVLTAADGTWSAMVSSTAGGRLRVLFPSDGVHAELAAAPLRITVLPKVTVEIRRPTVRAGRRVTIRGTVGPTWPARVLLTLERHTARGTVVVARKQVRVRDGAFATEVRLGLRGRHRLTIQAAGTTVRRKLRAL